VLERLEKKWAAEKPLYGFSSSRWLSGSFYYAIRGGL
jgi:hypothetical protein